MVATLHNKTLQSVIDPHLHFFSLQEGDYHWLKPENPPFWPDKAQLGRDYNMQDIILSRPFKHAGFVHIEAGFNNKYPAKEIAWLERHCKGSFRSIAAINLQSGQLEAELNVLLGYSSVVGVRDILDDRAVMLLSCKKVIENISIINDLGLIFEAQLDLNDSAAALHLSKILTLYPRLNLVINHAGFMQNPLRTSWRASLAMLASHSNCSIKASGWEMIARQWQKDWVGETVRYCISSFGISRVMLASNFPLSTLKPTAEGPLSYQALWQCYQEELGLTEGEFKALAHDNAQRIYGFI